MFMDYKCGSDVVLQWTGMGRVITGEMIHETVIVQGATSREEP
jgi:hypothetical protein